MAARLITQHGGSGKFLITFKLKKNQKNGNMGEAAANEAGIQAEQPQVFEGPNEATVHLAQPQSQRLHNSQGFNRYPCQTIKFHRQKNLVSNLKDGHDGLGVLKDQKDGENQVNTLIYSMGEEANDIVILFGLTTAEAKQYNTVKDKFESHFVVKRKVIFKRAKFNLRIQNDNESVDALYY